MHAAPPRLQTATDTVDVSVVIVTYNVREFLEQALRSVEQASAGLTVETFVVDNDSADGSAQMVRERFPDVRLIANEVPAGIAYLDRDEVFLLFPEGQNWTPSSRSIRSSWPRPIVREATGMKTGVSGSIQSRPALAAGPTARLASSKMPKPSSFGIRVGRTVRRRSTMTRASSSSRRCRPSNGQGIPMIELSTRNPSSTRSLPDRIRRRSMYPVFVRSSWNSRSDRTAIETIANDRNWS